MAADTQRRAKDFRSTFDHAAGGSSASGTGERPPRLSALTSMRFFAAMSVVLLHLDAVTPVPYLRSGWTLTQGVSFFFVLSGFILAYVYPSLPTLRSSARFLGARIARIWPLHLLTLAVAVLLTPYFFHAHIPRLSLALNALLLHAWVPLPWAYSSFNGPSFSLSIEWFLYLCFPLLLLGRRWTWPLKLGGALLLAITMIVLADQYIHHLPAGVPPVGLVYDNPLARVWEFTLGVFAAHVWRHLWTRVRLTRTSGTLLELISLAAVAASFLKANALVLLIDRYHALGPGAQIWLRTAGIPSLACASLITVAAFGRGWVSWALSWSPLVLLGEISYSIYMIHGLLLVPLRYRADLFLGFSHRELLLGYLCVVVLVSYVSWLVVEVPARRTLLRWRDRLVTPDAPLDSGRHASPRSRDSGRRVPTPSWPRAALASGCIILLCLPVALNARPPSVRALRHLQGTAQGTFDQVDGVAQGGGTVTMPPSSGRSGGIPISGWAFDPSNRSPVQGVFVLIDGKTTVWLRGGRDRPDVAAYFHSRRYEYSGFFGFIPAGSLPPGPHTIVGKAVLYQPRGYLLLPQITVLVR